jgi:hypothetical protein
MRREFGVDEETMFEKWSYWQFKAFLKAIPKALGSAGDSGDGQQVARGTVPSIDTTEMPLEQLAQVGLSVRRGPG